MAPPVKKFSVTASACRDASRAWLTSRHRVETPMLKIDLSGKLALLTGASGQLGRVMARTLAECGADLVLHYHQDQAGAERVEEEVRGLGRRALSVQADVGTRAGVQRIADAARGLGDP